MTESRLVSLPDGGIQIHAPAKLNLGLRVFPRQPDGYHPIESWMMPISLYDTLTVQPAEDLQLLLSGWEAGVPADLENNLVGRAALRLAQRAGVQAGARITLHKVIPPGGGLGGGSSDAAATLLALDALWRLKRPVDELRALALDLGSDVPFFVEAASAVCRGRGERLEPLAFSQFWYAVLFIAPRGISTGPVYAHFDVLPRAAEAPPLDWMALRRAGATEVNAAIYNDLETPALAVAPWLRQRREDLTRRLNRKIHLTGSGATLFTLLEDPSAAARLAHDLNAQPAGDCMAVPVRLYRRGEYPG